MSNPYDKFKQEAKYMAFDHGVNSQSKEDNPYEDQQDDPDAAALSGIWLQGYNSVKRRGRPAKVKEESTIIFNDNLDEEPVALNGGLVVIPPSAPDLSFIPTETLLAEVAKRMKDFEETVKRFKKIMG